MTIVEFLTARLDEDEAVAQDLLDHASPWDRYDTWTPSRMLAAVKAHRAIVEDYVEEQRTAAVIDYGGSRDAWDVSYALYDILRHLATIWSDHLDYDENWRP